MLLTYFNVLEKIKRRKYACQLYCMRLNVNFFVYYAKSSVQNMRKVVISQLPTNCVQFIRFHFTAIQSTEYNIHSHNCVFNCRVKAQRRIKCYILQFGSYTL